MQLKVLPANQKDRCKPKLKKKSVKYPLFKHFAYTLSTKSYRANCINFIFFIRS
jgi:hypothetical protein